MKSLWIIFGILVSGFGVGFWLRAALKSDPPPDLEILFYLVIFAFALGIYATIWITN